MRSKLMAAGIATAVIAAVPAAAQAKTLRFFAKNTESSFVTDSGKPLPPSGTPVAGDRFVHADKLYVGNNKSHAKALGGTAALNCLITSASTNAAGTTSQTACQGEIAIGNSMLLSFSHQVFSPTSGPSIFPINGGTGIYQRTRGTLRVISFSQKSTDSNFVLTLH